MISICSSLSKKVCGAGLAISLIVMDKQTTHLLKITINQHRQNTSHISMLRGEKLNYKSVAKEN